MNLTVDHEINDSTRKRSKNQLTIIELGNLPRSRDLVKDKLTTSYNGCKSISLVQFGDVLMSVLNGQKSLPYR